MPSAPLEGFVVVDVSRVLSGPYCTMMLRDLGALVIKVEAPDEGDEARHFLPTLPGGDSAYFAAVNRGKKSIALDLKAAGDRAVFERLLGRADALVENYRPGVLARLGYGFDVLQARRPALVLASISGCRPTAIRANFPRCRGWTSTATRSCASPTAGRLHRVTESSHP